MTATLAIAAASIVKTVVLVFAVLFGLYLIALLPESLTASFQFVLPAIFGGVIAQFAIKKPLWGIIGLAFGLLVNLGPVPASLKTFLCILGTVVGCVLLEKLKSKKRKNECG